MSIDSSNTSNGSSSRKINADWNIPTTVLLGLISLVILPSIVYILLDYILGLYGYSIIELRGIYVDFLSSLLFTITTLLPIAIYFLLNRGSVLKRLGIIPMKRKSLWVIIPAYGVYILVLIFVSELIDFFGFPVDFEQEQKIGFKGAQGLIPLSLTAVSLMLLPAVSEEVIFRGFIFGGLRGKLNFWLAAIISSLVFGLIHGQLNVIIDTFILGLVACYLYEKYGSILPAIGLHFLKNGIAFALIFLLGV